MHLRQYTSFSTRIKADELRSVFDWLLQNFKSRSPTFGYSDIENAHFVWRMTFYNRVAAGQLPLNVGRVVVMCGSTTAYEDQNQLPPNEIDIVEMDEELLRVVDLADAAFVIFVNFTWPNDAMLFKARFG
jgi:hypothetical protein